jgi:hypothetical protein
MGNLGYFYVESKSFELRSELGTGAFVLLNGAEDYFFYFFILISNGNYIKKRKGAQPLYTGSIQESP